MVEKEESSPGVLGSSSSGGQHFLNLGRVVQTVEQFFWVALDYQSIDALDAYTLPCKTGSIAINEIVFGGLDFRWRMLDAIFFPIKES